MKKLFFTVALFATAFLQYSFAQDTTKTQASSLLTSYFTLKDALVSSNANVAAASAAVFAKEVNDANQENLKNELRNALLSDAIVISQSKDLKVQREKFASLSTNMLSFAKTVKLSKNPVYQQYCPMKKASWLSDSKTIKNPYYGNAMLNCGSVKETF